MIWASPIWDKGRGCSKWDYTYHRVQAKLRRMIIAGQQQWEHPMGSLALPAQLVLGMSTASASPHAQLRFDLGDTVTWWSYAVIKLLMLCCGCWLHGS